jgi:predicted O-linked N-acetylglucosamine transferase (SPINDLY family)
MALSLARSPERLSALRDKLAGNRSSHPLFDMDRLCRHIESAYTTMWKMHCEGAKPASFAVPRL